MKPLYTLLALSTLFRLILSQTIGFGVDESYMLAHAPHLSLSYFDHPPLHVWVAHVSQLVFGETSHFVRLPFVLLFTGTSWFLYKITEKLYSAQAGFWAVFALNMGLFFSVSAGMMVVPDGCLLFFLAAATYILLHTDSNPRLWLAFGVSIGLAGLSKYHAALYGLGVFAYLLMTNRLNRYAFIGAGIALALQAPTLIWNMQHEWVSFAMQGSRGAFKGLNLNHFAQMLGGELMWLSPLVAVPLIYAAFKIHNLLLYFLALPTILIFTFTPLWGDRGLPHWTMSGWFFLLPLLGQWLTTRPTKVWASSCIALLLGAAIFIIPHLHNGYLKPFVSKNDPALEAFEWNITPKADILIAGSWIEAGKLYIAGKGKIPVFVMNKDKRHFAFDPPAILGKDALIITNKDVTCLKPYFENITEQPTLTFGRKDLKDFTFKQYIGKNLLKPLTGLCD